MLKTVFDNRKWMGEKKRQILKKCLPNRVDCLGIAEIPQSLLFWNCIWNRNWKLVQKQRRRLLRISRLRRQRMKQQIDRYFVLLSAGHCHHGCSCSIYSKNRLLIADSANPSAMLLINSIESHNQNVDLTLLNVLIEEMIKRLIIRMKYCQVKSLSIDWYAWKIERYIRVCVEYWGHVMQLRADDGHKLNPAPVQFVQLKRKRSVVNNNTSCTDE